MLTQVDLEKVVKGCVCVCVVGRLITCQLSSNTSTNISSSSSADSGSELASSSSDLYYGAVIHRQRRDSEVLAGVR